MPSSAAIGYSTTFGIESATPGTYTNVAEVTSVSGPNMARDAIDVTHMTSSDQHREFIAGLMNGGEATVELNFVPAVSDAIVTALRAGLGNFRITFPNGVKWTFAAVVTGYEITAPLADKMTASATFQVSGKPTLS